MLGIIRQKGLLATYDTACKEDKEAETKFDRITEAYISYQAQMKILWRKNEKKASDDRSHTSKTITSMINKVFMLYSNLLLEEAR